MRTNAALASQALKTLSVSVDHILIIDSSKLVQGMKTSATRKFLQEALVSEDICWGSYLARKNMVHSS